MNIASAKQQIKDTVEAYLQRDDQGLYEIPHVHQRPIFLLGAPGIGKTAIMEQVAAELDIGLVSYSMTHHTRQSALGLPRIEHRSFEGFEFEASEYTMSEIVASIYDYMERTSLEQGILFLDEINCVSETLYPSMLQFLQFKTFGKHKVPDGWVVVCAGNPPEYNRSVHEFDIVTLDRLREIDVEPEYATWRAYAMEKGLHPAVTTFLEAKKNCFYKVESKPGGGKAFVTCRGWEDLADLIALYEKMGKPVDRDLFAQFLRDDEICDQFSVYYTLFQKYRSDYQVDSILAGEATPEIAQRAHDAEFDERVALIGLLLDALSSACNDVLELEGVCLELRDVLRSAKEGIVGGKTVELVLGDAVSARESALARRIEGGIALTAQIRRERMVISLLRSFIAECTLAGVQSGSEAFAVIEGAYGKEVARLQPAVDEAGRKMDAAFAFLEETCSPREMLIFMAELTTRRATTTYIAHYGNEAYYAHVDDIEVEAARDSIADRIKALDIAKEPKTSKDASVDIAQSVGLRGGSAEGSKGVQVSSGKAVVDQAGEGRIDPHVLADYYSGKQFEYGFASICKMLLPADDLKGKKVLDICSRRGRGVYKISSMVGNEGRAIGIDWSRAYVEESKDGIERAWHDSGLKGNNMDFYVAYPEDLISVGLGTNTLDVVYVNNVMTLFYDQAAALKEFARVLKPGGLLIMETVFADKSRDMEVVRQARAIGNSVQAALTREENYAWLEAAGFGTPDVIDEYPVAPDEGYKHGYTVPMVSDADDVSYEAVSMYIRLNV